MVDAKVVIESGIFPLKKGKTLTVEEDFEGLKKLKNKPLPYRITYYPLFRINKQGVKTFSGLYSVVLEKDGRKIEKQIGIVKEGYKIIRTTDVLKAIEKKDFIDEIKLEERKMELGIVEAVLKEKEMKEKELDLTPYEALKGSRLYNPLITEALKKELLMIGKYLLTNSYNGKMVLGLNFFLERVICTNRAIFTKRFGERIKHIGKKVELFFTKPFKIRNLLLNKLPKVNKIIDKITIDEEKIIEMNEFLRKEKLKEEIYKLYLQELELIQEARKGKILLWDYINVLTALSEHRLKHEEAKKYFHLRRKLNDIALNYLQELLDLSSYSAN